MCDVLCVCVCVCVCMVSVWVCVCPQQIEARWYLEEEVCLDMCLGP